MHALTENQITELADRVARLQAEIQTSLQRAAATELELEAERAAHERSRVALADHEAQAQERAAEALDAEIDQLYVDGRLAPGDEYEGVLRGVASMIGMDAFRSLAARLPARRRGDA